MVFVSNALEDRAADGLTRFGTLGCGLPSRELVAETELSDKEDNFIFVNFLLVCKSFHPPCP